MSRKTKRRKAVVKPTPQFDASTVEDGMCDIPKAALCISGVIPAGFVEESSEDSEVSAESADGGSRTKAFRGVVNSGRVFHHWYWGNFALDMDGVGIATQNQPVLRDHMSSKILGKTSRVFVDDEKQLIAEGELYDVTHDGREVLGLIEAGFPFQMSVGTEPRTILRVEEGESVDVNGHELHGPGHVFKTWDAREASITPLGADPNTSAALLSRGGNGDTDSVSVSVLTLSSQRDDMTDPDDAVEDRTYSRAEAEALADQRVQEAVTQAVTAERNRLSAIDAHARGTGVSHEFIQQLKADGGISADAAAARILQEVKDGKVSQLQALQDSSPETNNNPDEEGEEVVVLEASGRPQGKAGIAPKKARILAMPLGEDRFKAEHEANLDGCADEVPDVEEYVAFRKFNTA